MFEPPMRRTVFSNFYDKPGGESFACPREAVCYARCNLANGGVVQIRQVSAEKPDKKCHKRRNSEASLDVSESKRGPPGFGVGHNDTNIIHENDITLRSERRR